MPIRMALERFTSLPSRWTKGQCASGLTLTLHLNAQSPLRIASPVATVLSPDGGSHDYNQIGGTAIRGPSSVRFHRRLHNPMAAIF
jgi:hypothetical protein